MEIVWLHTSSIMQDHRLCTRTGSIKLNFLQTVQKFCRVLALKEGALLLKKGAVKTAQNISNSVFFVLATILLVTVIITFNHYAIPRKKKVSHVPTGLIKSYYRLGWIPKFLKPIDRQLLLVTIYWEIGFCGEFDSEEVQRIQLQTLWVNRVKRFVELPGLSRNGPNWDSND